MRISLATIALDEQDFIGDMLNSVSLAEEIIVGIDDRTTDKTAQIVKEYGGRAVPFTWADDFSAARNTVLELVSNDWVLALDADERLTWLGKQVIRDIMKKVSADRSMDKWDGFCFEMVHLDLAGNALGMSKTSPRLFRRRADIRYRGVVHEEVWVDGEANWCMVDGIVAMHHLGYDPTLWVSRDKQERNLRLLRKRLEVDPTDEYAKTKLAQQLEVT